MPQDVVDTFADEWGFIKTLSTTLNSIEEVRTFTDSVSRAGHWEGQAVEGFVVRTHIRELPNNDRPSSAPPYAAGSTFFFKVKFDEPYMMYRDWREVTRMLLSQKGELSEKSLPISKMKRPETKQYVRWVINEIKRDRKQFDRFGKGKGIIATRERFLAWKELNKDKPESQPASPTTRQFGKTVIVPVAIPGCGTCNFDVFNFNILIKKFQAKQQLPLRWPTSLDSDTPKATMSVPKRPPQYS